MTPLTRQQEAAIDRRVEVKADISEIRREAMHAIDKASLRLDHLMELMADAARENIEADPSQTFDDAVAQLTQTLQRFTEFHFEKRSRS